MNSILHRERRLAGNLSESKNCSTLNGVVMRNLFILQIFPYFFKLSIKLKIQSILKILNATNLVYV